MYNVHIVLLNASLSPSLIAFLFIFCIVMYRGPRAYCDGLSGTKSRFLTPTVAALVCAFIGPDVVFTGGIRGEYLTIAGPELVQCYRIVRV